MSTLRPNLLPFRLRHALGFRDLCRLAPVIGVFHLPCLPGKDLGLLGLYVAKVNFRVVVLRFLRLYRRFLAFLRLGCLFGLRSAFLRVLRRFLLLLGPATCQQGVQGGIAGRIRHFVAEFRLAG